MCWLSRTGQKADSPKLHLTGIESAGGTMADTILGKHQLEKALYEEKKAVSSGRLKDENPLDLSLDFQQFCAACRRGDLRVCQEHISRGININARDEYDYTPLILVRYSVKLP